MAAPVIIGLLLRGAAQLLLRRGATAAVARAAAPKVPLRVLIKGGAIAGGVNAGAQLSAQLIEHEGEWNRINWGAVGTAGALGAVGYSVLMRVALRFPAPLFVRNAAGRWGFKSAGVWKNLGAQQFFMCAYTYFLYFALHLVHNGWTLERIGQTMIKATADNVTFAVVGQVMQAGVNSPAGKRIVPGGYANPKVALLNSLLTLAVRTVIQSMGSAAQAQDDAQPGAQELSELLPNPPAELPEVAEVAQMRIPGMGGR